MSFVNIKKISRTMVYSRKSVKDQKQQKGHMLRLERTHVLLDFLHF